MKICYDQGYNRKSSHEQFSKNIFQCQEIHLQIKEITRHHFVAMTTPMSLQP